MKEQLARLAQRCREALRGVGERAARWWRRWRGRDRILQPGRTLRLDASAFGGRLSAWPLLPPRRSFELYLPAGAAADTAIPLLVWIHGCRQDAVGFAAGTRIRRHADERGIAVLMPDQTRLANPMRCWNWFDPATADGRGEAAIVLAQVEQVRALQAIDPRRIWIAGLSSGAALAAAVAIHSPQRFGALACHSGLPAGAARNVREARKAMAEGTRRDVAAIGAAARARAGEVHLPMLVIQGMDDATVAPANADALVAQALAVNGAAATGATPPKPDAERRHRFESRTVHEADWLVEGRLAARCLRIDGLGHAWSGGDAAHDYFDAALPEATALILDFFADQGRRQAGRPPDISPKGTGNGH
ncbi:MAG: PHB depolymerase family esterase [Burkholderiaceae bacterium]|jgi:poly(hydroxyalkanoate) depolymerase family esterase|nr:PHB depolymerase family esterase [Burkholderiaceae bacterium]MEB2319458.1 PHB depolymerase family esterase [Pseudomonadota bacterium]